MIKIGIHGATGKMGKEIVALLPAYKNCLLTYSYSRAGGNLEELCASSDVVIDFSSPEAACVLLDVATKFNAGVLIGTTGLAPETTAKILELSKKIAILQTPNTSLGVTLLNHLIQEVAQALPGYEVDILDIHHAGKKDAPSGTALMLGKTIAEARANEFVVHDHLAGARASRAIGFSAIRAGHATGEHEVIFTGSGETLILTHKTDSRSVFAEGAIKAALWLAQSKPGLYKMTDVLGIKP